jgi:hypothetical protein
MCCQDESLNKYRLIFSEHASNLICSPRIGCVGCFQSEEKCRPEDVLSCDARGTASMDSREAHHTLCGVSHTT